jgi:hypothetical protein
MLGKTSSTYVAIPTPTAEAAAKGIKGVTYNGGMYGRKVGVLAAVAVASVLQVTSASSAQTPQPFPRPGTPQQPARPAAPPAQPAPPAVVQAAPADPAAPSDASLGFPIYPTAQFLASYDAGRGQRYFMFGSTAPYADLVAYYRTTLKERGDQVFEQPPTHMFSVGRFREETMAFPPGVTIKDWTWGGSQGYPNPKLGAQPARFPTLIMIVPAPAGSRQ